MWNSISRLLAAIFASSLNNILLGAALLPLDAIGPFSGFPVLFVLPVALAAWYCGPRTAYALACLLPLARLGVAAGINPPSQYLPVLFHLLVQTGMLFFISFLICRTARQARQLQQKATSPIILFTPASPSGAGVPANGQDANLEVSQSSRELAKTPKLKPLKREVIADILRHCVELELWDQGKKLAGDVHDYDWLEFREAAGRFWLAYGIKMVESGHLGAGLQAKGRMLAIWPEGDLEAAKINTTVNSVPSEFGR